MGPVYEKIASAVGARYQVELPSTAGGTPSKLTTTAPWLTAKQEGNQLVVCRMGFAQNLRINFYVRRRRNRVRRKE
jgi:hypothetical protein